MERFIDINSLVRTDNYLLCNLIEDDMIIIGKIDFIIISGVNFRYDIDLSRVECDSIEYFNLDGKSINQHILPNSSKELNCYNNKLTSLPKLPDSLKELNCYRNRLTSLPKLPDSLEKLNCSYNNLTSLPKLPDSLQNLNCSNNQLTSFSSDQLPNSLKILWCHNNELTELPKLPYCLVILDCHNNNLVKLPKSIGFLENLTCSNNKLSKLPNLNSLKIIEGKYKVKYIKYKEDYESTKIFFYDGSFIEIEDYGIIKSNKDYIEYMDKIKLSKIKSARK